MCELAVESAGWLMVDPWEATNPEYIPTVSQIILMEYQLLANLGSMAFCCQTIKHKSKLTKWNEIGPGLRSFRTRDQRGIRRYRAT